jgi:hypothetical protein
VRKKSYWPQKFKSGEKKFPIETDPPSLQNSRSLAHKIALPNTIARRYPSVEMLEKSSCNSLQTKREREKNGRLTGTYLVTLTSSILIRSFVRSSVFLPSQCIFLVYVVSHNTQGLFVLFASPRK